VHAWQAASFAYRDKGYCPQDKAKKDAAQAALIRRQKEIGWEEPQQMPPVSAEFIRKLKHYKAQLGPEGCAKRHKNTAEAADAALASSSAAAIVTPQAGQ